jgi:hypothetical protein
VPFKDLGLPDVPQESVNHTSEVVMGGTIPFALGWAGVLTAVAGLVRLRERGTKKQTALEAKVETLRAISIEGQGPTELVAAAPIEPPSEIVSADDATKEQAQ